MVFVLFGVDVTLRVEFENPCTVSEGKMSPGLFQDFMDGYINPEDSPH